MSRDDLFDNINDRSYSGDLEVVNEIASVNCKEWEKEREYLEKEQSESFSMATRYYVKIKNEGKNGLDVHHHEGHIDFRSISDSISDAFLPIPRRNNFFVTCKKSYKSDDFENPTISTVPYTTPTKEMSLCSPASIWILLTILSNEFGNKYISLVDINDTLPEESICSDVQINEYSKLFENLGYTKHFYVGKKRCLCDFNEVPVDEFSNSCDEDFDIRLMDSKLLYAYIESEIPVYLVFKWNDLRKEHGCGKPSKEFHTVIAIGHTSDETGNISKFIIHDVSCAPFLEISKEMIDENLYEATVLLPNEIAMRHEDYLSTLSKITHKMFPNSYSEIVYRPFLMRSQRIKFWYTNKNLYPSEVQNMYSQADFPRYVWVFEISTPKLKERNRCIGQIIFDATESNKSMGLVLMNIPKYRSWYNNGDLKVEHINNPTFDDLHLYRDYPSINRDYLP